MLLLSVQQRDSHMLLYWIILEDTKDSLLVFVVISALQMVIYVWTAAILSAAYTWWCAMTFQNLYWVAHLLK